MTLAHTPTGFAHLDETRQKLGVMADECGVGVETAHNLLIDFLWARGYTQWYIVPPRAVNSARPRYSQSEAHTDRSDAFVIADLVRTDQQRWSPWRPPSPLIWQLRAKSSWVLYLTQIITRVSNRLRAVLQRYYPTALHTFQTGLPLVAAQLVLSYPAPEAATRLTWSEFEAFVRAHGYPRSLQDLRGCYARLHMPQPTAAATAVLAYQGEAVLLAEQYIQLSQTKLTEVRALNGLFTQHPDAPLFTSLPGTGEILAPGLLAKFGDDRQRFPTVASVQCLAGTCPVTEASGKRRVIHFRRACDHEWRWLTQEWARCSRSQSTWAATYWDRDIFLIGNTFYWGMTVLCGVNFPVQKLPTWLQAVSLGLPLTRGIAAARDVMAGARLDVIAPLLGGEVGVGLVYFVLGYVVFRRLEIVAKGRGTLELF